MTDAVIETSEVLPADLKMPQHIDDNILYEISEQHRDAALLQFSHSCGLFDYLVEPRKIDEIVYTFGWVNRKALVLLNGLVALGIIARNEGKYVNSAVANERLVRINKGYIGSYLEVLRRQWNVWTKLPEIMASDEHVEGQQRLAGDKSDDDFVPLFQEAMAQVCDADITALLAHPEWRPNDRVLDLGGGHGLYLAKLAAAHPEITGEVWDLPGAASAAEQTFLKFGASGRLSFQAFDLLHEDNRPEAAADVVMINHCLHHFTPSQAERLLRFAVGLLRDKGRLIVIDQRLDGEGGTPAASALFSFYLMVNNQTGQLHPIPWIQEVLESEGLHIRSWPCGWDDEDVLLYAVKTTPK